MLAVPRAAVQQRSRSVTLHAHGVACSDAMFTMATFMKSVSAASTHCATCKIVLFRVCYAHKLTSSSGTFFGVCKTEPALEVW